MKKSVAIVYFLLAFVVSLLFSAFFFSAAGVDTVLFEGASFVVAIVAGVLVSASMGSKKIAFASPAITVFRTDLEKKLFPDNQFYAKRVDDTPFVENGKTVQYPIQGANAGVEINRTVLPAQITQREDDIDSYDLKEFTSNPTLIKDTEELEVNYNKRQSVLTNHADVINEKVGDFFANLWLPDGADYIVRTTGTSREATSPSATGNRKGVAKDDLIAVLEKMNRQNVPFDMNRFGLIPAEFMSDVLKIDGFVDADKVGNSPSKLIDGFIGRLLGYDLFVRSKVGVYDNSGTPVKKALDAVGAASDNLAALFWHSKFVFGAKGELKVFSDIDKPEYYGSVFSAMLRAGGRQRKDKLGVVALVQTAV